jgi:hypothetical protein
MPSFLDFVSGSGPYDVLTSTSRTLAYVRSPWIPLDRSVLKLLNQVRDKTYVGTSQSVERVPTFILDLRSPSYFGGGGTRQQ